MKKLELRQDYFINGLYSDGSPRNEWAYILTQLGIIKQDEFNKADEIESIEITVIIDKIYKD